MWGRIAPVGAVREPPLQITSKCLVQNGRHESVQFGGGFGLKFFQRVHLGLKIVQVVDDAALRIPELRSALQRGNVAFADIAVAAPSIEDVFVALLEDQEQSR